VKNLTTLLLIALCLSLGAVLYSQENEPEDIELACNPDELIEAQAELALLLENFADDLDVDPSAALSQLYDVGQEYQTLALDCGHIPDDIGELFVGDDVERIVTALDALSGDPQRGQLLYNNLEVAADGKELGCVGCHSEEETGPLTEGTWTRWDEIRRLEDELEDYSFEEYMVESIVLPWAYLVPAYGEVMPNNFGDRMSYQDLADIILYLSSQDQFLD